MTDHEPNCEDAAGAYPGSCTCAVIKRKEAMDDLIAQDADLIEFMASDAACYLYPGEHQQAERAAYAKGCAEQAAELAKWKALAETLAGAVTEAREALHFHYVEWDGEPEDAVPLQLARSKCDAALTSYKEQRDERPRH